MAFQTRMSLTSGFAMGPLAKKSVDIDTDTLSNEHYNPHAPHGEEYRRLLKSVKANVNKLVGNPYRVEFVEGKFLARERLVYSLTLAVHTDDVCAIKTHQYLPCTKGGFSSPFASVSFQSDELRDDRVEFREYWIILVVCGFIDKIPWAVRQELREAGIVLRHFYEERLNFVLDGEKKTSKKEGSDNIFV